MRPREEGKVMSLGNIFNGFVYLLVTFVLFPRAVSAFDLDAHEAISLRSIKPGVIWSQTELAPILRTGKLNNTCLTLTV